MGQRWERKRSEGVSAPGYDDNGTYHQEKSLDRRRMGQGRSKFSQLRQTRFDAVTTLQNLLYNKEIDREDAYVQAERLIESLTPVERREIRIYNAHIRHAMRVTKVQRALRVMQDMKKNGIAPSMHTYLAIFMGARISKLNTEVQSKLAKEVKDLFANVEALWRSSFKVDTVMPTETKAVRTADDGPRTVPSTAESFAQTQSDAEQETREFPQLFERTCEKYLAYLFSIGQTEEAAKFVLRANDLAAPESRGKVEAKTLSLVLATEYLRCIGREGLRSAPELVTAEATRHARSVLSSFSDDRNARQERRILTKVVQGGAPLALTHEDMQDILGSEMPPDGPPSPRSRMPRKL